MTVRMKKRIIILIIVVTTIFSLQYYVNRTNEPSKLDNVSYSQSIPNLSIVPLNEAPFSLSDKKGTLYILNFWATWCPPCIIEIPHLIALNHRYQDQGIVFIGISLDESDIAVNHFIKKHGITYPITMFQSDFPDFFKKLGGIPTTLTLDSALNIIDIAIGYREPSYFEKMIKRAIK
tara:strand:- start:4221 stop:4751 length:531 start_codon:yes stop_codon:yes gene_type:complete